MEEQKRFQNKKLNKEAHKGIKNAAKGVKRVAAAGGILITVGVTVKKVGIKTVKELPKLATMIIKR